MDPSSLYSSGPTNGNTNTSSTESLKRKRGTNSKSQSRSKSNTPTPSSASLDDPSTSASTSKPTAAVRFQSPSIPNQSQSQPSNSPKSNPISLGPNSIPSSTPSNPTPTPTPAAPVKGKAGWPKGKPRGPKNASSTSNNKSKSSSASSTSRANAQAAKEQAAAAQAQREAEAAARELEQKQRLELEALKDANPYGDEEEDTKLYCICKTLYDESKMMIACDTCDEWYHVECMGISERQAELIDMFICLNCETETQKTTYKPPCLRPDCTRAALPPLSRYCSERCGLLMASARILKTKYAGKDSEEYGGIERLLSGRVKTARRTEGIVTWGNDGGLTSFKKEDENENEKEVKHQDSELIDGEMTKIEEKENQVEEKEKENKVEEKEKSKEKEVPTVGQEWFGKFSDCWGSEDRKANEMIRVNDFQESSFENEFLKNVKKLSLNVDGVDRNLLNNLFPISTISESNSSPMKEIQDTINSNPSDSSNFSDHQNSKLTISSTKSQEELLILRKRLLTLLKRKEKVNLDLDSIQARYKLLQLAEDRLSNLEPVKISEETTSSSSSSNKKGKKGGKPKKDSTKDKETSTTNTEIKITTGPPCGYDSRLNWDEERFFNWSKSEVGVGILNESLELDGQLKDDWDDVVEVEDDENGDQRIGKGDSAFVCNTAKRKCKKHTDWSMVRGADFEVEKEVQTNLLSQISLDLSALRDRINTLTDLIAEEKKSLVVEEEQQKQLLLEQEQREKEKKDEELARTLENEGKRQRG